MHNVARSVLRQAGRPDLAADAVHDAIESVMANPPDCIGSAEAFLVRVAKNKARDIAKSHAVSRRADLAEADGTTDEFEAEITGRVDRQRLIHRLRHELTLLPPPERRVIEEVVIKERTGADVASEIGLSPARVSQLKKDGLRRLRGRLGKEAS
ncbi:MAG: sigma-70 family RNA polymerase sigma factor [Promicromonosporaceae bacterium]|nr:sigma-70 family RNA polymerase sigma factor [Promicromonosporaceae bacterium]